MACPVRAAAIPTDNASALGRICQDPAEGGEEHLHHHDDREDQAAQKAKSLWHIQTLNEFSRKMKK